MPLSLRPGTPEDAPALSRICLLTGNYGTTAEHLHSHGELLGLVYAEPYVRLPGTYAFVLVDTPDPTPPGGDNSGTADGTGDGTGKVVGYIIGAYDTPAFEETMAREWFPPLAARYPVEAEGTEADKRFYKLFANPPKTSPDVTAVYPSHLHIDILPAYQRSGWGRRMLDTAIRHLSAKGYKGVWAGIDPRNEEGRKWYIRLEFRRLETREGEYWAMDFDRWDGTRGRVEAGDGGD